MQRFSSGCLQVQKFLAVLVQVGSVAVAEVLQRWHAEVQRQRCSRCAEYAQRFSRQQRC